MRWVRILVRGLGLVALLAATAYAGYEEDFERTKEAAWAIYTRSVGGISATCSATAIRTTATETLLLTAGHCFLGSALRQTDYLVTQDHRVFVHAAVLRSGLSLRRGQRETSTDLADYEGDDWALVVAKIGEQKTLPLGDSSALRIGEDLIVVGVPLGVDFLAVQGVVGSRDLSLSALTWNHYFGANIYVAGGNSGSGVVAPRQKAVVGIVNAGPGPQSSMMIFMPIQRLPAIVWP